MATGLSRRNLLSCLSRAPEPWESAALGGTGEGPFRPLCSCGTRPIRRLQAPRTDERSRFHRRHTQSHRSQARPFACHQHAPSRYGYAIERMRYASPDLLCKPTAHKRGTNRARSLKPEELLPPFGLFEADEHEVAANDKRAFYQHAVLGQQCRGIRIAHAIIQQCFYVPLAIQHAACVEEAADRQAALRMPGGQFVSCRILLDHMTSIVGNAVFVKPRFCFFACRAFRILG